MGFPVGYTDFFIPDILIHFLTVLSFIRKLISTILQQLGLEDFLEPDFSTLPTAATTTSAASFRSTEPTTEFHCVSALLIRELLPAVKFSELVDPPESCAVCLYDFEGEDEIRRLTNCRHIFHRCCIDRWMDHDHDQKTCPLCRTPFILDDLNDSFNQKLEAASGIGDYYGESSPASGFIQ